MKFGILILLLNFYGNDGLTTRSGLSDFGAKINSSGELCTLPLASWLGISIDSLGTPVIASCKVSSSQTVPHFLSLVRSFLTIGISLPTILPPRVVITRYGMLSIFE